MRNKRIKQNFLIYILFGVIFIVPNFAFASIQCSPVGYSIITINGVLTNDDGAKKNKDVLQRHFGPTYNNEPLTIDYLLNPAHVLELGGLGTVLFQKFFESETVQDYDLVEMLNDASAKVKTQKLLLVAHSQGNFYANSFYDTVVDKTKEVPVQSIGIYGVADPASRTAGSNGKYITSNTDHVINWVVGIAPFGSKIMHSNLDIPDLASTWNPLTWNPVSGHDFSEVYLSYAGDRIVKEIQASLSELQPNNVQDTQKPCISPQVSTLKHKVGGVILTATDHPIDTGTQVVLAVADAGIFVAKTAVKVAVWYALTAVDLAKATYHTGVNLAVGTYHIASSVVAWTYQTGTALASTVYSTVVSLVSDTANTGLNNSASVILATQNIQPAPVVNQQTVTPKIIQVPAPQSLGKTVASPMVINVSANPGQQAGMPRLVFVGNFTGGGEGGGGAPAQAQALLGYSASAPVSVPEETTTEVLAESAGAALAAPALSAPQCTASLATNGCLLATTTVRFEWAFVSGADHYLISKNGILATTTELSFETAVRDFSDYTFEITAVDNMGIASATSTKIISVATIPIAINEIAWMGTAASANNEWIELKNNTGHTIDLSQWALKAEDGTPYIKLTKTIAPHEYLLLERTRDTNVVDIAAHQIYAGALENTGDQLTLSYASTTLDQTPVVVGKKWAAGENISTTTKKTMERYSSKEPGIDPANWGTNLGFIENGTDALGGDISGTPGKRNSVSYLVNKGNDIMGDLTLTTDEGFYVIASSTTVTASSTLTLEPGVEVWFYEGSTLLPRYCTFGRCSVGGYSSPAGLDVQGVLKVNGTPEDPVVLGSLSGDFVGSILFEGNNGTSTINNAHIEKTKGISVNGARLEITNSELVNNNSGIEAYDGANLIVASTTINGTRDGNGIVAYDSMVVVASSTIIATGSDAIVLSNATSTIANTTISREGIDNGVSGIAIEGGTATVTDSTVFGFVQGVGISVISPTKPIVIKGGEITGNAVGVMANENDPLVIDRADIHDNGENIVIVKPIFQM